MGHKRNPVPGSTEEGKAARDRKRADGPPPPYPNASWKLTPEAERKVRERFSKKHKGGGGS